MDVEYSNETLRLGRQSFHQRYRRNPTDAELKGYIDALLNLGLAVLK
jgi:hypothetical protein